MQKSTWGGLGAWMLALVAGLASAGWPEYVKPHPYVLAGLGVIGIGCIVISLVHRAGASLRPHDAPVTVSQNITASPAISPTISPVFAPVFNASPPLSPVASAPVEARPIPNLQSLGIKETANKLFGDGSVFILRIENTLKDVPIEAAYCACANLKFRNRFGQTEIVESAYWNGYFENAITIPAGKIVSVVLGRWHSNTWYLYSNPRIHPPHAMTFRVDLEDDGPIASESIDLDNGDIYLDVKIFTRRRGIVLLEDRYRIDSQHPFLQRIEP